MTKDMHGSTRPGAAVSEKPTRRRQSGRGTADSAAHGDGAPGAERVIFRDGARVAPSRAARLWASLHLAREPRSVAPVAVAERPVSAYRPRRYVYLEEALMSREMDRL